jgi:hypothetical protein
LLLALKIKRQSEIQKLARATPPLCDLPTAIGGKLDKLLYGQKQCAHCFPTTSPSQEKKNLSQPPTCPSAAHVDLKEDEKTIRLSPIGVDKFAKNFCVGVLFQRVRDFEAWISWVLVG